MKFNRDSITKQFKNSPTLTVTFTKANGDERVMTCTVDLDLIPEDKHPKPLATGQEPKPLSDTTHTVWEIGTGWRSFKYENIISVEAL